MIVNINVYGRHHDVGRLKWKSLKGHIDFDGSTRFKSDWKRPLISNSQVGMFRFTPLKQCLKLNMFYSRFSHGKLVPYSMKHCLACYQLRQWLRPVNWLVTIYLYLFEKRFYIIKNQGRRKIWSQVNAKSHLKQLRLKKKPFEIPISTEVKAMPDAFGLLVILVKALLTIDLSKTINSYRGFGEILTAWSRYTSITGPINWYIY